MSKCITNHIMHPASGGSSSENISTKGKLHRQPYIKDAILFQAQWTAAGSRPGLVCISFLISLNFTQYFNLHMASERVGIQFCSCSAAVCVTLCILYSVDSYMHCLITEPLSAFFPSVFFDVLMLPMIR